jgi:hypothetical protein
LKKPMHVRQKAHEGILDVTGNGGQERTLVFISVTLEMLKCARLQVMDSASISDKTLMHESFGTRRVMASEVGCYRR